MATRISIFACVVMLVIPCIGETKVDDALVVYLPFDSGAGKAAKDVTKHGNDGQFIGNVKWGAGKFDGGILSMSERKVFRRRYGSNTQKKHRQEV